MLLIPARPGCDFAAPAASDAGPAAAAAGAFPIVLCDCGLEGATCAARELTERYDDLLLLTAAEIPDHLP